MKKRLSLFLGAFVYIVLALVLSAYDNATMHRYINDAIVQTFLGNMPSDPALKNYSIQQSARVNGTGVTAKGQYYITEGDLNFTFKEWLSHGGFSADEPEALQAMRHFYDPVGLDGGKKYLTDFPALLGLANPEVDLLSWALEHDGEVVNGTQGTHYLYQNNSWEDGKRSFAQAMQEKDPVKQNKLMAHAWRCLGESLHALADVVCPVHVRNDGHPPGDADPLENAIRDIIYLPSDPQKYWDQSLIDKMKGRDSIRQIFHDMALYTNQNFFTNQTIYGDGVESIKPVLRPGNPYPLPYAKESGGGWEYVPEEFTYYKSFGNNRVKMCKDRYYFANVLTTSYRTPKAYVDLDVAKSQSAVLLSNLMGIGPEVIKRFLPPMKVTIDDIASAQQSDKRIRGSVEITRNPEYSWIFSYNNRVTILNYTKNKSVEVLASNGKFETAELAYREGDLIMAYITLGGFQVLSEKIKAVGTSIFEIPFNYDWLLRESTRDWYYDIDFKISGVLEEINGNKIEVIKATPNNKIIDIKFANLDSMKIAFTSSLTLSPLTIRSTVDSNEVITFMGAPEINWSTVNFSPAASGSKGSGNYESPICRGTITVKGIMDYQATWFDDNLGDYKTGSGKREWILAYIHFDKY